jgi:hypothetical protein
MTLVALASAIALPWLVGAALILALPRARPLVASEGGITWTIGAGWFAGVLALTLWMRGLALVGVPFGVLAIAGPLLAAAAVLAAIARKREGEPGIAALVEGLRLLRGDAMVGWRRTLWFVLLAWLALRAALLLGEVAMHPLYPWEAWTIWATKARVFFELRTIVPFVTADLWNGANEFAWFDAAPHAPLTLPLLAAWICTALGRFDDALMNLPWWVTGVALALATFGALRQSGQAPLGALGGAWLAFSLPLVNAHIALAGYADLFLAGCFSVAALAVHRYAGTRAPADLALGVALAAALPLVKTTGVGWAVALLPGIAAAVMPSAGARVAGGLFGVAACLIVVLTRTDVTLAGRSLRLQFAPQWSAFGERMLLFDNWHLLWYAAVVALMVSTRALRSPALRPLTLMLGGGLAFAFLVFAFPMTRTWFAEPVTPNRTFLVVAPLTAALVVLLARDWTTHWQAARATAQLPNR